MSPHAIHEQPQDECQEASDEGPALLACPKPAAHAASGALGLQGMHWRSKKASCVMLVCMQTAAGVPGLQDFMQTLSIYTDYLCRLFNPHVR